MLGGTGESDDEDGHDTARTAWWRNAVVWLQIFCRRRRARILFVFLVFAALVGLGKLGFGWALLSFVIVAAIMIAPLPEEAAYAIEAAQSGGGTGGSSRDQEGWRALVDAISEPAIALDAAANVMHHNALVRDLFPNIRTRRPFSNVSRHPELMDAIDRAGTSRDPIVVDLFERVPLERRISATVSRLTPASGARGLPSLLVTFRDQSESDKLAQMRADFIANASHELRTPLASLRGFVETLQGPARDDPSAREKFLAIMASQAARMTRLIDDLLSLSRVEMRVHLRPTGIVELNEMAGYVAQTMEPLAETYQATIIIVPLETPGRIRGDREEIVQVLQNLVHNALKYGREGGRIEVRLTRERDSSHRRIVVSVTDDGPGIAPEHLPRLTERFYRASASTSKERGGTGLGLAIVKHIVNRHRGDLRIVSKLGKGSTFSVIFDET